MEILANDNELLKCIEISNKIEALLNEIAFNEVALNKRGLHSILTHNNEDIITKTNPYGKNLCDFKKLIKDKCRGHSILLFEFICEVENKYYPQVFLNKFSEKCDENNVNSLFKELVQTVDWSDDKSDDECIYKPSYKFSSN